MTSLQLLSLGVGLALYVVTAIGVWPVFVKAGIHGGAAFIPIVNLFVLVKIAGLHGATVLLHFVPIANIVLEIVVAIRVGRAFHRGRAFAVLLLWLLAPVGYFVVGYGRSRYDGPDIVADAA